MTVCWLKVAIWDYKCIRNQLDESGRLHFSWFECRPDYNWLKVAMRFLSAWGWKWLTTLWGDLSLKVAIWDFRCIGNHVSIIPPIGNATGETDSEAATFLTKRNVAQKWSCPRPLPLLPRLHYAPVHLPLSLGAKVIVLTLVSMCNAIKVLRSVIMIEPSHQWLKQN
jgi:hypothetical protein